MIFFATSMCVLYDWKSDHFFANELIILLLTVCVCFNLIPRPFHLRGNSVFLWLAVCVFFASSCMLYQYVCSLLIIATSMCAVYKWTNNQFFVKYIYKVCAKSKIVCHKEWHMTPTYSTWFISYFWQAYRVYYFLVISVPAIRLWTYTCTYKYLSARNIILHAVVKSVTVWHVYTHHTVHGLIVFIFLLPSLLPGLSRIVLQFVAWSPTPAEGWTSPAWYMNAI